MKNHNILKYYIFTLIITIILGGIAGSILDPSIIAQYAINLALIQMSPLCGLILLCVCNKNWDFIKNLQLSPTNQKNNIKWIVLSMLIPAVIIISSAFILSAMGNLYIPSNFSSISILIVIIASIIGCFGEEMGWRGFMLHEYTKKYSLLLSAIFTGLLWGAWHLGKIQINGIVGYLLFILMITEFSIIMAWIYSKTNRNLVCMILFHLSINISSMLILTKRESISFYLISCMISAIICILIITLDRNSFFTNKDSKNASRTN